jgi:hypothetical protein
VAKFSSCASFLYFIGFDADPIRQNNSPENGKAGNKQIQFPWTNVQQENSIATKLHDQQYTSKKEDSERSPAVIQHRSEVILESSSGAARDRGQGPDDNKTYRCNKPVWRRQGFRRDKKHGPLAENKS